MAPSPTRPVRRWQAILLALVLLPAFFLRERIPPPDYSQPITVTRIPVPPVATVKPHLGAFRLEGIWQLTSRNAMFGGYSTLQRLKDGRFLTISDRGYALWFSPPDQARGPERMIDIVTTSRRLKRERDAESSAYDPATGRVWIGWEGSNAISRNSPDLHRLAVALPAAMRDWDANTGPESMVRLADGRFLVLAEGFDAFFENRRHEALAFPGDPTGPGRPLRFTLEGPERFSPTDMAQMPDGRVLILMRRAVWPMPFRFAGRIVLADPAEIRAGKIWRARTVAYLSSSLPVDNFEGIVAEPGPGGRVVVWIMSDDNIAATQRTLLWKMSVDPKELR